MIQTDTFIQIILDDEYEVLMNKGFELNSLQTKNEKYKELQRYIR